MSVLTKNIVQSLLRRREADSHKGTYGHTLLVAGSMSKMGAAVIAARACLRCGTGLLTVNVPAEERLILQMVIPEAMLQMRGMGLSDWQRFSAIGIGPGIGTGQDASALLYDILNGYSGPLLLDADALNILSADKTWMSKIPDGCVLTPHPKEFDRLFGSHETVQQRMDKAVEQARLLGCVIVLKGAPTLITFSGQSYLNSTGNAGLAKGGSGDALTGMIAAFLSQGYDSFSAAIIAVYLHGLAADITLQNQSMESMLISDVIELLGKAFQEILL